MCGAARRIRGVSRTSTSTASAARRPGIDADREEPAVADRDDQRCGEQGADDRAERVHRSFDAECSAQLLRRHRAGQQRVARGCFAAARDPRDAVRDGDEGPGLRERERAVTERGDRVAAGRRRLCVRRRAGRRSHRPATLEADSDASAMPSMTPSAAACAPIVDEEAGERGGGHLVSGVGEQAAEPDAEHAAVAKDVIVGETRPRRRLGLGRASVSFAHRLSRWLIRRTGVCAGGGCDEIGATR